MPLIISLNLGSDAYMRLARCQSESQGVEGPLQQDCGQGEQGCDGRSGLPQSRGGRAAAADKDGLLHTMRAVLLLIPPVGFKVTKKFTEKAVSPATTVCSPASILCSIWGGAPCIQNVCRCTHVSAGWACAGSGRQCECSVCQWEGATSEG